MIIYKDILQKLKDAGYNSTRLRKEKILSESVLQRLRTGGTIKTDTIDKLCTLLDCDINNIMEYKKGQE